MGELPSDIIDLLERISEQVKQLRAGGELEKVDSLQRVARLLQCRDFPSLSRKECDCLASWRGANRKLGCLTEHRRLILDKWLSASRLRLSTGPRRITDQEYEEWRSWLAAHYAGPASAVPPRRPPSGDGPLSEDSPTEVPQAGGEAEKVLEPADKTAHPAPAHPHGDAPAQHDGGVADAALTKSDGAVAQRIEAEALDAGSNALDRVTAPAALLEPAIAELLGRIPDTWQAYRPDDLSEILSQALFLLTAAGMVARRERLRVRMADHPLEVDATIQTTGEHGAVQALEPLAAQLWPDWQHAFCRWQESDAREASPFHCTRLEPSEWRLTDQGVLARDDLAAGPSRLVFDFVLGQGFFDGRPRLLPGGRIRVREPVGGEGRLVRMDRRQAQAATTAGPAAEAVPAGVDALARAMCGMFQAMQAYAGTGRSGAPTPDRPLPGDEAGANRNPGREALAEANQGQEGPLPDRMQRAYGQYLTALPNLRDRPTDRECYNWAKSHNEDSPLPSFDTWQRYVRAARRHYGEQKNAPRAGRRGRSIEEAPRPPRPREHGYVLPKDEQWHKGKGPDAD
jgi:hypothetical protein